MTRPIINPQSGAVLVGLMSGTSLDGISACVVRFVDTADGRIETTMLAFTQRAYSVTERERLESSMRHGTAREYCRLHADLGDWLADAAVMALADAGVARTDVAAIASHGHTVWHEPPHSTWQLGDASRIAERTGCAVVADFRARDVAAGGQGAPLVPMADARLFAHATEWRALQNLGGIGNVTVVPPRSAGQSDDVRAVRAFDTGPGVVIIDAVTRALRPELPYDRDGALARAGTPIDAVVAELLDAPFFREEPPKSTGREWFSREYIDAFMTRCQAGRDAVRDEDIIATATAFTARSIADQYARFLPEPVREVVVAGGGAKNPTLLRAMADALAHATSSRAEGAMRVARFDDLYFDGEAKEAVAFALLGYLHLTGRSGNVPGATGSRGARTLGHYTPAT
ncbi:MAG: anhydro-N-acetylmuramic acid kinase [Gemmatimonadaceae bacterium]|nr:anhydro-N-acetylmuramic acid kinase [Gemmatimonadaceae bacterium]